MQVWTSSCDHTDCRSKREINAAEIERIDQFTITTDLICADAHNALLLGRNGPTVYFVIGRNGLNE